MIKKIIYVDMDGVLCDYAKHARELGLSCVDAQYVEGFYDNLEPMPGAITAYRWLSEHFDTYVLSCACWDNTSSFSGKINWIKKYLPEATKKVILSHHKELNKGDYLIDDRPAHGSPEFEGEWIPFGDDYFKDWNTVIDYIKQKENIKN